MTLKEARARVDKRIKEGYKAINDSLLDFGELIEQFKNSGKFRDAETYCDEMYKIMKDLEMLHFSIRLLQSVYYDDLKGGK